MKIRELIQHLQTLDQDMLVVTSPYDGGIYYNIDANIMDFMTVIRTEDESYRDTVDDGTFTPVTKDTPNSITVLWL